MLSYHGAWQKQINTYAVIWSMVCWNEIYNEIYICQALPDLFDGKRGLIFSVFIAPSSVGLCNPGLLRNLHGHAQTANRAIVHFSASALLVATFRWHGSCSDKFGVVSSCHLPIHQQKKKKKGPIDGMEGNIDFKCVRISCTISINPYQV